MPRFAAILPAAGTSSRFGGPVNKLLIPLSGVPVLARSIGVFLRRSDVGAVIVPTSLRPADFATAHPALSECLTDPRVKLCAGGSSRAESVRFGLLRVPGDIEWVAVHDAARPLVSDDVIDRTLAAAERYGAAVPALPVSLTIKQAATPLPARVERTVPRHTLFSMQTPQVMRREALLDAFERCPIPLDHVTDDAQLLELVGQEVWLVPGDEQNLKFTTAMDLRLAELLLAERVTPTQ